MIRIVLTLFLLAILGCSTSSADLNKIAQDSIKSEEERKEQAMDLNYKYLGADKNTILAVLGRPKRKSNESYPYRIDLNCRGSNCERDYSDEIWFYEFKKKYSNEWEIYSIYVYFKSDKVVRIR